MEEITRHHTDSQAGFKPQVKKCKSQNAAMCFVFILLHILVGQLQFEVFHQNIQFKLVTCIKGWKTGSSCGKFNVDLWEWSRTLQRNLRWSDATIYRKIRLSFQPKTQPVVLWNKTHGVLQTAWQGDSQSDHKHVFIRHTFPSWQVCVHVCKSSSNKLFKESLFRLQWEEKPDSPLNSQWSRASWEHNISYSHN